MLATGISDGDQFGHAVALKATRWWWARRAFRTTWEGRLCLFAQPPELLGQKAC